MTHRNTKIIATLGPASADEASIRALADAGADVFRLNFSHGSHDNHRAVHAAIRRVEAALGRPLGILMDLQGPKLRLGTFADGKPRLTRGARIQFDLDSTPGDARRVCIPHPEIIAAVRPGAPGARRRLAFAGGSGLFFGASDHDQDQEWNGWESWGRQLRHQGDCAALISTYIRDCM